MERTHLISGEEILIIWERGEMIENHGSGCVYYALDGIGSDGKDYIATGYYQDDELEDIEYVELA
jgi:hypothetical protein